MSKEHPVLKNTARRAGLWYFLMLISGPVGLVYVPDKVMVAGDAMETAGRFADHEFLIRIGIISNIICQISFIFLVLTLYQLFKGVSLKTARLMVALVLVAVPVAFLNELFQVASLLVNSDLAHQSLIDQNLTASLTYLFTTIHEQGTFLAGFFWGLWLLPFGWLVIRSGFIPKLIGYSLVIGCFSYLADSTTAILFPQLKGIVTDVLMLPLAVGEISAVFWLLIIGVKPVLNGPGDSLTNCG